MNFYQYYNIAISESNSYCIPALDSDEDIEVWGWSLDPGLPVRRWYDDDIDVMEYRDNLTYDVEENGTWVTKQYPCEMFSNLQELENAVNVLFEDQPLWLEETRKAINDFKQKVNPISHGVYKIFGEPKRSNYDGYWWICYILDAKALTDFKVNKINNALSNVKNNTEINKLFKK